ncbi:hypothetical protein [Psychromonas sp. MB-3u-54]|uniref:hypothetical protein n=1 Tax=Psychromonas sp. MB-3u-54 TaxID=2058319 RepID=UPI0012FF0198|nr:hypothetical protein [Psychromonas sp. MB-3u-54]
MEFLYLLYVHKGAADLTPPVNIIGIASALKANASSLYLMYLGTKKVEIVTILSNV